MTENQNPQQSPETTPATVTTDEKKKSPALKIAIISVIVALIIALGAFLIFPKHIDYFFAERKFKSGEYEEARLDYWDLGDFKDSEEKVLLCHEGIGDEYLEEKRYEDAVNSYAFAENTEKMDEAYYQWAKYYVEYGSYKNAIAKYEKITTMDVLADIIEAEYLYFLSEKENHDILQLEDNYTRFKALADSNYKDSKTIFEEAYAWDAKVYLSNEENDFTFETQYKINFNDKDKISRKDKMYFTIHLQGGIPGEELKIKIKASLPGGISENETYTLGTGEYITWQLWYTSPSNASTGNGTLKIYNAKTDKLLFTKKFTVTK